MIVNIKLGLLIFLFAATFTDARRRRYYRQCRNATIKQVQLENISSRYYSDVIYEGNRTRIDLKINLTWDVAKTRDAKVDGFLIRFADSRSRGSSILPLSGCQSGENFLWMTSSNASSCSNAPITRDGCPTSSEHECLCSLRKCKLMYGGSEANCLGSDYWVTSKGYLAIQPHIRSLSFNATFNSNYAFDIKPYYREYVGSLSDSSRIIPSSADCIETLQRDVAISADEAAEACCNVGVPHVIARNVTVGALTPDFRRDSVNVSITWLPPISHSNLEGFVCFPSVFAQFFVQQRVFPKYTTIEKVANPQPSDESRCDNIPYYYKTTLYDLIPGKVYDLQLSSIYKRQEMRKYGCRAGLCRMHKKFAVPAVNACEWGYCHEEAICQPENVTGIDTLKANCTCKPGYHGDGLSKKTSRTSTGCVNTNHCENRELHCVEMATCMDNSPPLDGVECRCPSGHFGDGYVSGTGCTSTAILGLKIGIPIILLLALCLVMLAWKAKIYEIYKKTFEFAQFSS